MILYLDPPADRTVGYTWFLPTSILLVCVGKNLGPMYLSTARHFSLQVTNYGGFCWPNSWAADVLQMGRCTNACIRRNPQAQKLPAAAQVKGSSRAGYLSATWNREFASSYPSAGKYKDARHHGCLGKATPLFQLAPTCRVGAVSPSTHQLRLLVSPELSSQETLCTDAILSFLVIHGVGLTVHFIVRDLIRYIMLHKCNWFITDIYTQRKRYPQLP